ncbi:MAG: cyclic nucleotide-binding domain-containing protein [Gemmataceae bacterium]|nr:cyclic nucleotide-binding domain-containing protein [Gemmataceae bacterium]
MTEQGILGVFAGHKFLSGLSERHRLLLAAGARPFTAAPNQLLAKEGDTARCFYLIQSGHVSLGMHTPDRGVVPIHTVGPGEEVGWSWLVPPHRWQFDCRAVDEVHGLAFDAEWLREKCELDHELGYHLLKQLIGVLANRLAATRVQLLDLYK